MKPKLIRAFRKKLNNNCIGIFSKTTDSSIIEIIGHSDFDFTILDNEHGYLSYESLLNHIRAAENLNLLPIVRTPNNSCEHIGKALDIGAYGVQVPNITTKKQVEELVKFAKFSPLGNRGVCKFVRSAEFTNLDKFDYFKSANNALIIIQIEGVEGIKNLDEILSVKGIDILFVGPYDLSQSLGLTGEISHPEVINTMTKIIDKAKSKNIMVGTFCDTFESAKIWKKIGVNYISFSVDYGLIMEKFKSIRDNLN